MSATINLESLADVIETELVNIFSNFIEMKTEPEEATLLLITNLYDTVGQSLHDLVNAIREGDERAAENVLVVKGEIGRIANDFLAHQSERIGVKPSGSGQAGNGNAG
jgi:phosphate:Na+ symporter